MVRKLIEVTEGSRRDIKVGSAYRQYDYSKPLFIIPMRTILFVSTCINGTGKNPLAYIISNKLEIMNRFNKLIIIT